MDQYTDTVAIYRRYLIFLDVILVHTKSEVMDEKERDIYINHLTRRAIGARTVSSPAPTEAT
jgi:hypothetical protein